MRSLLGLLVPFAALFACGGSAATSAPSAPPGAPPGWTPLEDAALPAACGARLETAAPPPRASSLRTTSCDFGETRDTTRYDLNCAPGDPCTGSQTGDQLCHRVCDGDGDGECASGEVCEARTLYVSDTPSRGAKLCMCAGGACSEKPPAPSTAEGGIDAWRSETSLPNDLYYHASAATDRQLFVAGGLKFKERYANGGSLDEVTAIVAADLDANGAVGAWREVGQLPRPMTMHAMAAFGGRLYVSGGDSTEPRKFSVEVFSYPIAADGTLGERRAETDLPKPRGWHVMEVDVAQHRLVVAAGGTDASYFSDGTPDVSFATIDETTGVLGAWQTISMPAPLYYDHGAGIAAGNLYGFVAGEYLDRSSRALYGIRLADVGAATQAKHFVRNGAWPFDPSALDAVNERVRLAGTCDALVMVGDQGAVATSAVDAAGHVGVSRAAARFEGNSSGFAIATSPSGRVYATGGTAGTPEQGAIVRSTRRL